MNAGGDERMPPGDARRPNRTLEELLPDGDSKQLLPPLEKMLAPPSSSSPPLFPPAALPTRSWRLPNERCRPITSRLVRVEWGANDGPVGRPGQCVRVWVGACDVCGERGVGGGAKGKGM